MKTLKDLELNGLKNNGENIPLGIAPIDGLRQEAINWIKMLKVKQQTSEYDIVTSTFLGYEVEPMITWIKHFFNLTEEELK